VLRIRDVKHGSDFLPSRIPDPNCLHPGSRGQKGTGCRIRNTVYHARSYVLKCEFQRSSQVQNKLNMQTLSLIVRLWSMLASLWANPPSITSGVFRQGTTIGSFNFNFFNTIYNVKIAISWSQFKFYGEKF